MSNKKISQLTSTTTANDNVWLIINDSGETTTNKIKRADLLSGATEPAGLVSGTGTDSMKSADSLTTTPATSSNNYSIALGNGAVASGNGSIAVGYDTTATGNLSFAMGYNADAASGNGQVVIGWSSNASDSCVSVGGSNDCSGEESAICGYDNTISSSRIRSNILGSTNTISGGQYQNILGGRNNTISSSNNYNNIIGASNSQITGTTSGTTILGISNFTSPTNDNTTYVDKLYSVSQDINGTRGSLIVGGDNTSTMNTAADESVIVAGRTHTMNGDSGFIGGGRTNSISALTGGIIAGAGNSITAGERSGILAGQANSLSSPNGGAIIAGRGNSVSSSYSAILAGEYNTLSHNNSVMLGGSSNTSVYTNTAHAEHNHTFKTETFDTVSGGTIGGSIDVDISEGTIFKFTMSANTTPNFINWKEGQRIEIVVVNSASYTVPTATITGGGSVYAKGGSLNPTNSGITKYKGIIIDGDLYLNEELNFQAV